jgi:hypothetical protein
MKRAQKIRRNFPEESLDWREVLSLPTPDRVNVSLSSVVEARNQSESDEPPSPGKEPSGRRPPAAAPARQSENQHA